MEAAADSPPHRLERPKSEYFNVPVRDDRVIERPARQETITHRYVEESIRFIRANRDRPVLPVTHGPHHAPRPLFAGHRFAGRSPRGPYGDVVEEIDAGVGRVLETAHHELGLDRRTLVVLQRTNGPWLGQRGLGGPRARCATARHDVRGLACASPRSSGGPAPVAPGVVREMGSLLDVLPSAGR